MPSDFDTLPFNPYIHGTSSHTLSMMQHTDFKLMPVLTMLHNYKVAPMVGELTQGGYVFIGYENNNDTIAGAPAFGRMQDNFYNLDKVLNSYTSFPDNTSLSTCKEQFQDLVKHSHKSAFSNLNLLMIYLVRLRQLGVKLSDIMPLDDTNTLKERLNATVQFYYFILCIQKYIFFDGEEMVRFKQENNLTGYNASGDHIKHFFSFETFIEKIRTTQFDIETIYHSPSPDNINKLIEFVKISKDSQEHVKRNPSGEYNFIAKRDYHFFTPNKPEMIGKVYSREVVDYLFQNEFGCTLDSCLESYYQAYCSFQEKDDDDPPQFPDFEAFHLKVLPFIEALKDRVQLCNTLLDAHDNEFVAHNQSDDLITKPFPVILVTEAKTLEAYESEYRSRTPLKLGKEIVLVATDNKENQQRLRNYLQRNNVGPLEVLLFDDLYDLRAQSDVNNFDSFANDVLMKAFEVAEKQNCVAQFSKLYRALSELNEKRYRFKSTHTEVHEQLNHLFIDLQHSILTPDKDRINFKGIQDALQRNKQENYTLYATHRGVLGVIDSLLTMFASLIVFYPITYFVQKNRNSPHTFFATDTEKKVNSAVVAAEETTRKEASIENQF